MEILVKPCQLPTSLHIASPLPYLHEVRKATVCCLPVAYGCVVSQPVLDIAGWGVFMHKPACGVRPSLDHCKVFTLGQMTP